MNLNSLKNTILFIVRHPLNAQHKRSTFIRFLRWQLGSRLLPGAVVVDFVENAKLLIEQGMTGATGNVYTGLHEFEDMAFVLHMLRKNDRFVDVGANVGSYTVLASAVVGARSIAIEPIPNTYQHLVRNINLNGIHELVTCLNIGIGKEQGVIKFTASLDAENHVVTSADDAKTVDIEVRPLDNVAEEFRPVLIKIDVEGYESEVLAGGTAVLTQPNLLAVILELNGLGARYGFDDSAIHLQMAEYGFQPYLYQPLKRQIVRQCAGTVFKGNIIYVRDKMAVENRLQSAPFFSVRDHKI